METLWKDSIVIGRTVAKIEPKPSTHERQEPRSQRLALEQTGVSGAVRLIIREIPSVLCDTSHADLGYLHGRLRDPSLTASLGCAAARVCAALLRVSDDGAAEEHREDREARGGKGEAAPPCIPRPRRL